MSPHNCDVRQRCSESGCRPFAQDEEVGMPWVVLFHPDFEPEFGELPEIVQDELLTRLGVLQEFGPSLGRPNVDTLQGSSFPNMKDFDSGLMTDFGALLSLLIPTAKRLFWWEETKSGNVVFTKS
jgi:hypothetical protein